MNKKYFCFFAVIIVLAIGCTKNDDIKPDLGYARFLQESVIVSPLGGSISVPVEWSEVEWEIVIEEDNGVVTNISPKTGGKLGDQGNSLIRFTCSANTTGKDRKQDVFIVNNLNEERSKLIIEQILDSASDNDYYVSNSGSDDFEGNRAAPFKTIAKAASVAKPGDTIKVKPGTYVEESIIPAVSGIEGAMIVFKPVDGVGTVTIKHPSTGYTGSGMVSTPIFDLTDRNYIRIEGFEFKDFQYDQASIFIVRGEWNVIMNNRFENLGNNLVMCGSATCAVYIRDGHYNVVRNNYFNNIYGDGVGVKGGSESSPSTNNLVTENTFLNFKGKPRGWAPTGSFSSTMNTELQSYGDNIFAFNYGTKGKKLIWFDRNGSGNIVLRNVADDMECLLFNESRCVRNLVQENIASNTYAPAFETARYETGWTEDARWINNVTYNCKIGFYVSKSWRDEFRNNIVVNSKDYNLVFTNLASASGPHIFKNNLWYTKNKANSIQYEGRNISVKTFASQVGETGTLSSDPQFVDPQNGDFRLKETSPAKKAGDNGMDLGVYPVYGKTKIGYDESLEIIRGAQVGFSTALSSVPKDGSLYLTVSLDRNIDYPVSVEILPIAGDAREGVDFNLNERIINFGAGERTKNIHVSFQGTSEHDQLIAFYLQNPINVQVGPRNVHLIRIKNK